jgi:hypothetical protein
MAMAAKTGSAVAAAVTVAKEVADNNRNCGGWQQSTNAAGSIGSSRDSGRGSSNCCSMAAMAGRDGGAAEVTKMRAEATATIVVVNFYPLFPFAMVRKDERKG